MKKKVLALLLLFVGWQAIQAQNMSKYKALNDSTYKCTITERENNMKKTMKFCQSCGMPLTDEVLGTNADGSKNEDYCIYCYKDGKFLQDCTMEEMIEHCAQFVDEVNKNMPKPMTKEEYKQMMRGFFPMLKRWK